MSRNDIRTYLEHIAYLLRKDVLTMTTQAGSGHPTSALSAADLVAGLFFYGMGYDAHNYYHPDNDRFILSKGHASPILYAAWAQAGVLSPQQLLGYRQFESVLEGHPTRQFEKTEAATGSLGMGLSIGTGMALYAQRTGRTFNTYVLLGDAETSEGQVWEAAEIAAHYRLDNLVAIIDCNRLGQSTTALHEHHTHRYAEKFQAFGWHTIEIDGHNMQQVMDAYDKANAYTKDPVCIIAKTIKGYGIAHVQDQPGFHGKAFSQQELSFLLDELKRTFSQAVAYASDKPVKHTGRYGEFIEKHQDECNESTVECEAVRDERIGSWCAGQTGEDPAFEKGALIATRKAYGIALTDAGRSCDQVYSLDGEVSNSTYSQMFKERFPERFIECYVAEQNMVSMGVGLARRGVVPFISTFGAFFSRAHDQIRMAAISQAPLRLVGSHAGISIGQDGPSQMALEDIALMRCLPESIILYPSDAVSTYRAVQLMLEYNQGMSYLRTTRMDTPVVYEWHEEFQVGECKILREHTNARACIVAAGVTLFQALMAYEQLLHEGIEVTIIDLFSVKPLPTDQLLACARAAGSRIITVEDHYMQGGIGEAIACAFVNTDVCVTKLAVTELPCSGMPKELLSWAGIDAAAIVHAVKKLCT